MNQALTAFSHVLNLIKKTGERCIILPTNGDEPYVLMSLPEYERLAFGHSSVADLTESELLDRINRDIAIWKSQQENSEEKDEDKEKISAWSRPYLRRIGQNRVDDLEDLWDEYEDKDVNFAEDPYYFENV